jgi:hypothetical protein
MGRKARILLVLLSVTTALAISGTFHHCYVIDSLRPDPRENTPPSVNYSSVTPDIYHENITTKGSSLIIEFAIPDIYDPDPEPRMYGRWALDYEGSGTDELHQFAVTKKIKDGEEQESWWEATFRIEESQYSDEVGTHFLIAAISDRDWDDASGEYFAVPEDTMPVYVQWTIEVEPNE